MPQISLDIQESMADRLHSAAAQRNHSLSSFIISIITDKLNEEDETETRKILALEKTQGAFKDEPLSEPPEIPWETDTQRKLELL